VTGQRIERLYAFVATEAAGDEGLAAFRGPGMLGVMPMVGADRARVEALRPRAMEVAAELGVPVTLCVFEGRVELERIDPAAARRRLGRAAGG
jgi:hypothetical protein